MHSRVVLLAGILCAKARHWCTVWHFAEKEEWVTAVIIQLWLKDDKATRVMLVLSFEAAPAGG